MTTCNSSNKLQGLQQWLCGLGLGTDYSIDDLKNLQTLSLSDKQLQSLPESIGELKNLQRLYLNDNQLQTLPPTISELSSLRVLNIRGNQIREIPESFKRIENIIRDPHVVFQPPTDDADVVIFRNVSKTFVNSITDILMPIYETEIVTSHTRRGDDEHIQFIHETVAKKALMFGGEWSVPREELIVADEAREMRDKYITEKLWADDLKVINDEITDAAAKGKDTVSIRMDFLKCDCKFLTKKLGKAGYSTEYKIKTNMIHIMW